MFEKIKSVEKKLTSIDKIDKLKNLTKDLSKQLSERSAYLIGDGYNRLPLNQYKEKCAKFLTVQKLSLDVTKGLIEEYANWMQSTGERIPEVEKEIRQIAGKIWWHAEFLYNPEEPSTQRYKESLDPQDKELDKIEVLEKLHKIFVRRWKELEAKFEETKYTEIKESLEDKNVSRESIGFSPYHSVALNSPANSVSPQIGRSENEKSEAPLKSNDTPEKSLKSSVKNMQKVMLLKQPSQHAEEQRKHIHWQDEQQAESPAGPDKYPVESAAGPSVDSSTPPLLSATPST
jgi:hypothetical protein